MWPMLVDYSDEECKKALRCLELDAYSSIVNAFRAQGTLTKDKKRMLQELSVALSITVERHRSEIRRAINDEHLSTMAERLSGPNTVNEWAIEGRHVVPLMQRLAPQTAFTGIANSAATAQASRNVSLPLPGKTGDREILNGLETMASRKRKHPSYDCSASHRKIAAMDPQFYQCTSTSTTTFDASTREIATTSEISVLYEGPPSPEILNPVSSFSESHSSKTITAYTMASMSQSSSSRHNVPKTTTATTLSSFDQLTSNLLASRASSKTYLPAVLHEEQVSTKCEPSKPTPSDLKTAHRPSSSHTTVKSSTNVVMTPSLSSSSVSSPSSSPKDRLQTLPCTSVTNKFLSQFRSKNTGQARQNLPAGLGQKLNPQPLVSQRATLPPKSPMKPKENSPAIFKKTSPPVSESQSSSNESVTILPKSPVNKPKTENINAAKPQVVTKTLPPKTTAQHNSQYISRSLFSTTATNKNIGTTTKSLSPVIFNVSTASSTALNTSPKMTGVAAVSEAGKTTQLVTKTSSVGVNVSHVKINTSNAQTFQYRNDGGFVRSARIVNLSQPAGTRLPCAISPSAISALGLPPNALRVTVPAGTLGTSSIRVSAAQKPNVIVVHKAQVYQRPTQASGAVVMTSAPMSKVSNDIAQETQSIAYKQDKNKPSGSKPPPPRTVTSIRPQSPANSVSADKTAADAQCKKNLLADIMEASGILLENTARKNALLKDKNNAVKNNKDLSNHQEIEIISQKGPGLSESNTSKTESTNNSSGSTALTVASVERNGVDTQKQTTPPAQLLESQTKDTCNTVVSPVHNTNDNLTNSSGSKGNQESAKEKDS